MVAVAEHRCVNCNEHLSKYLKDEMGLGQTKAKTKANMKRKAKNYKCVCSFAAFGRDARS